MGVLFPQICTNIIKICTNLYKLVQHSVVLVHVWSGLIVEIILLSPFFETFPGFINCISEAQAKTFCPFMEAEVVFYPAVIINCL